MSGYTSSITGDKRTGFVVTNTKTAAPPSVTPKTGDASHPLFYLLTLILSGAGLIGLLRIPRRRSRRKRS